MHAKEPDLIGLSNLEQLLFAVHRVVHQPLKCPNEPIVANQQCFLNGELPKSTLLGNGVELSIDKQI